MYIEKRKQLTFGTEEGAQEMDAGGEKYAFSWWREICFFLSPFWHRSKWICLIAAVRRRASAISSF